MSFVDRIGMKLLRREGVKVLVTFLPQLPTDLVAVLAAGYGSYLHVLVHR